VASAQSLTLTRLGTRSTGATEEANCLGIHAVSWPSLDSISDGDGHDVPEGGMQVNFHIGDNVQMGTRVGTVTDVGTILIQVKTTEGRLRVVCPWELVRTRDK
jgi:hypothetical protein